MAIALAVQGLTVTISPHTDHLDRSIKLPLFQPCTWLNVKGRWSWVLVIYYLGSISLERGACNGILQNINEWWPLFMELDTTFQPLQTRHSFSKILRKNWDEKQKNSFCNLPSKSLHLQCHQFCLCCARQSDRKLTFYMLKWPWHLTV